MYKARRFTYTAESLERELADLKSKVHLGTKLRDKLYGGDYVPTDFDSFVNVVLKYMSVLPRPKAKESAESAKRAVPTESRETENSSDPNWDNQGWDQGYVGEPGARANDSRMLNGARAGKGRSPGGKAGKGKGKGKTWHPSCSRCYGRHESWIECPNVTAAKRGFDATKHPGMQCDYYYKDRNHDLSLIHI